MLLLRRPRRLPRFSGTFGGGVGRCTRNIDSGALDPSVISSVIVITASVNLGVARLFGRVESYFVTSSVALPGLGCFNG